MPARTTTLTIIAATAITITAAAYAFSQNNTAPPAAPPAERDQMAQMGMMLMQGLATTPGCIGVEVAQTLGGKNVIFAWFENKEGAMRWHTSDTHRGLMRQFFPRPEGAERREAMANVPDDVPLLVIASLTPASEAHLAETQMPISQIAIEIYAPVSGGLALGGRFAPDALEVPDMKHYQLPKRSE